MSGARADQVPDGRENQSTRRGVMRPPPASRNSSPSAAGPRTDPQRLLALQRAAGNRAVARALGIQSRSAARTASDRGKPSTSEGGRLADPAVQRLADGPGPGAGGGAAGEALAFLEPLPRAAPSELGSALATAGTASPGALAARRDELLTRLPPQPAPTGMATGPPAVVPGPTPAVPAAPDKPAQTKGELGPSGPSDPAVADQWAASGSASIASAAATATVPAPDAEALVRPVTPPVTLPSPALGRVGGLPTAAPAAQAAGEEQTILNATMGPDVAALLPRAMAPSVAVGSAQMAAATAIGTGAQARVVAAEQDSTARQQAVVGSAGTEVTGLRDAWTQQKAGIVQEHQGQIAAEAGQTRAEAMQTMAAADAQAKETEKAGQTDGGEKPSSLWGRIKSAGVAVVSTVRDIAASVVAGVQRILTAARERVNGLLGRLVTLIRDRVTAAVKAITDGARRAAEAVAGAIRKAQAVVTRLAQAAQALASRIWQAAAERLRAAWSALHAAAAAALRAAATVVKKVAGALGTIKEIVKLMASKLLGFVMDLVNDPQGKIVDPIVAMAGPMVAGVPAKAAELTKQNANPQQTAAGVQRSALSGAALQRSVIQRSIPEGSAVQRQVLPPKAPPGETFMGGVKRHLGASVDNFLQNWASILGHVVWDVLTLVPVLMREGPALWAEIRAIGTGGGGVDRLDHVLGSLRHLVSIIGSVVATVGVWALIIGLLGGPVAEGVVLTAYEGVSIALISADLTLAAAEMGKYAYSATRPEADAETRERYIGMFTGSGIAAAITLVLIALGMLAARLAKAFKASRLAAAAKASEGGKKPPAPTTESPGTKPAETTPPENKPPETPPAPARYDPTVRTNAELQLDLDPAPRPLETPEQAAARVEAARGELQTRAALSAYEALGEKPPRMNMAANDAAHGADGAHTIERHGPQVELRRGPPGTRTIEGRIHGDPPWGQPENWSYKWIDEPTMNRTINDHIAANWEKIRSDLAQGSNYDVTFDAKGMVGEGFFNEGMMGTGARVSKYGRTSYVTLRMRMAAGPPPKAFVLTTFPSGLP